MIYSIPYVILVLIYGLLADYYRSTDEAGKSRINMVCIAIFLFFFGFRGFVSHDWVIYYPAFEHVYSIKNSDKIDSSSIGYLNYNTKAYILDHEKRRVPVGAVGELYLSGYQIAEGYLNRDEKTKKAVKIKYMKE